MKTAFYVESYGRQVEEKALIVKIKEIWSCKKATRSKTSRI